MTKEWILPELKAEIEAARKHKELRERAKKESELFDRELFPRYALIDAALWSSEIYNLLFNDANAVYCSLFKGVTGENLQTVAPYLVDLQLNEEFNSVIKQKKNQVERRVMWIHTELGIDELRTHFRHFLRMKTENDKYIYSRFYDPYVANSVFL